MRSLTVLSEHSDCKHGINIILIDVLSNLLDNTTIHECDQHIVSSYSGST